MKNTFLLLILIISICSCNRERLKISDVFPTQVKSDSILVISLDTINSISEINNLICEYKPENYLFGYGYIRIEETDIPIYQGKLIDCGERGIPISCFKSKQVIEVYQNSNVFLSLSKEKELNEENFYLDLKNRFLENNPSLVGYSRRFFIDICISDKVNFSSKEIESKLQTISKSYYKFLQEVSSKDSVKYYKNKYPLNINLERPFTDIPVPPPPPFPEKVIIDN